MLYIDLRRLAAVAVFVVSAASCSADSISVVAGTLVSLADDGVGTRLYPSLTPINPLQTALTAIDGANHTTSTYDLSNSAFRIGIDQVRDGTPLSNSETYGSIDFIMQPDAAGGALGYALSGNYSVTDASGGTGSTFLYASLLDVASGAYLSSSTQESHQTIGESFILGQSGGDYANGEVGSLTGTLIAGRTYRFVYDSFIAYHTVNNGASAIGNVTLTFSDSSVAAAPLPPVIWSAGSLLVCLGGTAVWRNRRHPTQTHT